jgi:peptide/nickel transport system permease protein
MKNSESYLRIVARRFRKNRLAVSGSIIILLLFAVALLAPALSQYDPARIDVENILSPPGTQHWMGTDESGRDVLSRMIYGARISMLVGFVAVGIATFIGILFGAVAGYYSGRIDAVVMRFVDLMLCFPTFFLILAVIAVLEPSLMNIMIVIGVTGWMGVARLVRAEFLALKEQEFVQAARAFGASDLRIIFRHLLPNAMAPVFVSATFGIAGAILTESALSFFGLGVQPPTPSWGNILSSGYKNIDFAYWLSIFPGLAILVTALGYNLLGEGLRDALDPRLKGSE